MSYTSCFYELFDEKEYKDFIFKVEKQFRNSYEYTLWLNSKVERDCCAVTGKSKHSDGIRIEVHHYILTLYDWVVKILDSFLGVEPIIPINSHYICMILSDIHLNGCVPYIPLSSDLHDEFHFKQADRFFEEYPQAIDGAHNGNIPLAEEIIEYHVNILKERLNLEANKR